MRERQNVTTMTTLVCPLGMVCALLGMRAPLLLADFYDSFHDGAYCQDPNDPNRFDPNLWDIDNPHWTIYEISGDTFQADASAGELHLLVSESLWPAAMIAADVGSGDLDPNTSPTVWNDSLPHYIVARVRYDPAYVDPNENRGMVGVFVHGDMIQVRGYLLRYDLFRVPNKPGRITLVSPAPLGWCEMSFAPVARLDEPNGFWLCLQFESDGAAGDPNGKFLKAACWDGGKFDWDGLWQVTANLGDANTLDEPPDQYLSQGRCGVMTWSDIYYGNGFPAEASYDDVEARTGTFSNLSHTLSLRISGDSRGKVTIEPDLVDAAGQPNDPNDPNALRRYTTGTEIVLVADAFEGRGFKGWTIYDPNFAPGDANHAFLDSNAILYLTMDADYVIKATFTCSGSGQVPLLAVTLLVIALTFARRRYA